VGLGVAIMNVHIEMFQNLIRDNTLRIDPKYHSLQIKTGWNIFNSVQKEMIELSEILVEKKEIFNYDDNTEYFGIQTGSKYINKFGDIRDSIIVTKEEHPQRLKYKVSSGDILISSLRYARVPVITFSGKNIDLNKYVFSNGFYILKVKNNWNTHFVFRLLKTKKLRAVLDNNLATGIGISNYKITDLLKIKVPNVPLEQQDYFVDSITPLEKEIELSKTQLLDSQEIIDKVFFDEFNLDVTILSELPRFEVYNISFNEFSNNKDLRNSAKFHKRKRIFIEKEFHKLTNKKIKDFLSEPATLGFSAKSNYFDQESTSQYISMAELKNWNINTTDVKKLKEEYLESAKRTNKIIRKNDILMCRSGEGTIGKVAHVDETNEDVYADFVMRLSFKNYSSKFAYYFFRTTYFQSLIEIYKKGLGNNTNIYPKDIHEFPLLDISLDRQKKILEEIEQIFIKQDKIISNIDRLNLEIDENLIKILI